MKKILNNRPLFFCFLAFGLGILIAKPIFSLNVFYCVLAILLFGIVLFLCCKFKKFASFTLICLCFGLGVLSFYLSEVNFGAKNYGSTQLEISGRTLVATIYESSQNVILDNVYINGNKVNECINVHIYNSTGIKEGTILTFNSALTNNTLFTLGSFNSYNYKYNIHYFCSVNLEDIAIDQTDVLNWSERLRASVKNVLYNNMGDVEASVSYASLFGDKTYIESGVKTAFSVSGIAHLLAVSGLHIGFLVTILTKLLNKTKLNKYLVSGIMIVVLGVYAYLCNFSASVLRACLMFFVLNIAGLFGKKYDRLNAWSLAGILCLIIKPLSVYDGGFLLSFACVLCIFMFAQPLTQLFIKWHIPKKLAFTLGVTIPVQFGLLPLISLYYTEVSVFSLIANLICVPVFEIFFTLLFLMVPIVLIIAPLGFLLFVPKVIISAIIAFATFVGGLDFAIIHLTALSGLIVICFYVIMFCVSHFVNLNVSKKIVACFCLFVASLLFMVGTTYNVSPKQNQITILNGTKQVYFLELDSKSFAVGYFDTHCINLTKSFANNARLYGVDYFISLNTSTPADNYFKNVITFGENHSDAVMATNNVAITPLSIAGEFAGVVIKSESLNLYFASNNSLTDLQLAQLAINYSNFDLVAGKTKIIDHLTEYVSYSYCIKDGKVIEGVNEYCLNINGNWTFSLNYNTIENMRGVD